MNYFSLQDIEQILRICEENLDPEDKARFTEHLNEAAELFFVLRHLQREPAPSSVAKKFQCIRKAATNLLTQLGLDEKVNIAEMPAEVRYRLRRAALHCSGPREGMPQHVDSAIEGIQRVARWAYVAERQAHMRIARAKDKPRHKGNVALNVLVESLVATWVLFFDRRLSTSVSGYFDKNPGKASGPLVRFISECLKALRDKQAGELNPHLNTELDKSPDAIREIIRRLELYKLSRSSNA